MKKLLIIALIGAALPVLSQKIKVIEGSLKPISGQKSIQVEFTYDNMIVGKDKSEEAYIAEKKKDIDKKEPGRGDKWEQTWYDDRQDRFEPQFRELFSKNSSMSTVGEGATYKLIFKTTRTEPGWNVGVMRANAYIDAEVWFVEVANPDKVVAKVSILNSPGRDAMGYDFDTGTRIQEAYAKAGKALGQFIVKAK